MSPLYHSSGAADALVSGVIGEALLSKVEQLELFVDTENYRAIGFF
ncbi:hypothetical protein [Ruegeria sp. AU67]|nr:hypothetical protein [Ruegeria sp. AU67]